MNPVAHFLVNSALAAACLQCFLPQVAGQTTADQPTLSDVTPSPPQTSEQAQEAPASVREHVPDRTDLRYPDPGLNPHPPQENPGRNVAGHPRFQPRDSNVHRETEEISELRRRVLEARDVDVNERLLRNRLEFAQPRNRFEAQFEPGPNTPFQPIGVQRLEANSRLKETEASPVDKAIAELVTGLLSAGDRRTRDNLKKPLKTLLEQKFDAEQQARELIIVELQKRLQVAVQKVHERAGNKSAIVQQQLQRMMGLPEDDFLSMEETPARAAFERERPFESVDRLEPEVRASPRESQ